MDARVVALHVCVKGRAPLRALETVTAVADRGLEGDRHARAGSHRQVLVVEAEVLDRFGLGPGDIREQVTVRGLDLGSLAAGARFRVGGALLEVAGPCDPCERMNEIRPGLRAELEGRRGRFMRVVDGGAVSVGDRFLPA